MAKKYNTAPLDYFSSGVGVISPGEKQTKASHAILAFGAPLTLMQGHDAAHDGQAQAAGG